jgi:hypothetical protein
MAKNKRLAKKGKSYSKGKVPGKGGVPAPYRLLETTGDLEQRVAAFGVWCESVHVSGPLLAPAGSRLPVWCS